jgi:hypothetical protein
MDAVLEAELLDADRAARMHAAGGDADLGAEAEFAAIGELGRSVVDDDGGIDLGEEAAGGGLVRGDDRIGVMRAVALDMVDRASSRHGLHRDDPVEIFGPSRLRWRS